MKAITIWQPWASLVALGVKKYETRSWPTKYRGPIAIHAGMKPIQHTWSDMYMTDEARRIICEELKLPEIFDGPQTFPTGCILATAELINVWHIVYHPGPDIDKAKYIDVGAESLTCDKHAPDFGDYFVPTEKEFALGDWTPGRYAWELANVKILPKPIPAKGKQGLWNWEQEAQT